MTTKTIPTKMLAGEIQEVFKNSFGRDQYEKFNAVFGNVLEVSKAKDTSTPDTNQKR